MKHGKRKSRPRKSTAKSNKINRRKNSKPSKRIRRHASVSQRASHTIAPRKPASRLIAKKSPHRKKVSRSPKKQKTPRLGRARKTALSKRLSIQRRLRAIKRTQNHRQRLINTKRRLFAQLEDRAKRRWQRDARFKGISYAELRTRMFRKFKPLSWKRREFDENNQPRLMRSGKHKGKYRWQSDKGVKYLSPTQWARLRKNAIYWREIRELAALLNIPITEARKFYKEAHHDDTYYYADDSGDRDD